MLALKRPFPFSGEANPSARSLKVKRKQVGKGKACLRCRKWKIKCNGERPCATCEARNCSEECTDGLPVEEVWGYNSTGSSTCPLEQDVVLEREVVLVANPGRPIDRCTEHWTVEPRQPESQDTEMDAQNCFLRLIWGLGYNPQVLARILRHATPSLKHALDCLERNITSKKLFTSSAPPDLKAGWENSERVGQVSISFDHHGLMQSIALNGVMQNHWGAHPEEIAARMSSREVPIPSSEYRLLCMLLDGFYSLSQKLSSRIICAIPGYISRESQTTPSSEQKYIIVRVTSSKHYDSSGRIFGASSTAVQLSADEYEAARAGSSIANGHFLECERTGTELMNVKGLPLEESLERMNQSEEGRRKLDRLADRIMRKFKLEGECHQISSEEVQGGGEQHASHHAPCSEREDFKMAPVAKEAKHWLVWSMKH
mmetsp:Transcript_40676/g.83206  ORF Transcript_40676/g.83206 Transcript_40676/m.83206 type:complete len:429 (+) Transcript_40676:42-1328(+)